jgi:hypothetical protein
LSYGRSRYFTILFFMLKYPKSDLVRITKVVGFLSMNPTKLVLQFSEFPTIFYTFYKILQSSNTIEDGIYHRDPCKESGKCNWVPRPWEAAAPAEFRRAGGAPGRASDGTRLGSHLGSTGGRSWDGGAAGVGDRRRPAAVAAAARVSGEEGAGLDNT